ncbi:MFS transporter [Nonomuraea sp. SMC257]|uniref:MFS transporter n=1 Tax=Nonomuraea montanisoli TaxID=2741721 RepID=A0A7Y6I782_9ACTN|nr:MFS transporter [Nonomuraea montanisoli]NUW32992.1 MFS transporter [Nonomuraea montanisoli]
MRHPPRQGVEARRVAPPYRRGRVLAPAILAFTFWATMAGTTAPTPLYPLYEHAFGFGPVTVTVIFAVYAFGVVAGLLLFGRLSDEIGRRPVLMVAALLAIVAAAAFLVTGDVTVMLAARVVSGLSAALVTGAATVALAEAMPPDGRIRPATVALFANMGGLAGGTVLAGILADLAPAPLRTPWALIGALALLGLAGVAFVPETAPNRSRPSLRLQRPHVPAEIRGDFVRSAMAAGAGFAVLGVLTAVTGVFLSGVLRLPSATLTGAVVFTAFMCTAAGQLLNRVVRPGRALVLACGGLVAGSGLIALAMAAASLPALLAGAAVNGLATGMALGYGVTVITTRAAPDHRGASVSTYFVILYSMLAVPAVGVGVMIRLTGLRPAGEIFSAVVAVLALGVLLSLLLGSRRASRHA